MSKQSYKNRENISYYDKKKADIVIEILILISFISSFTNAFAPPDQRIDENNPIERYRNNFPVVEEGE